MKVEVVRAPDLRVGATLFRDRFPSSRRLAQIRVGIVNVEARACNRGSPPEVVVRGDGGLTQTITSWRCNGKNAPYCWVLAPDASALKSLSEGFERDH